jgi:hypothetical protein
MFLPILFLSDFFLALIFLCVYVRSIFWNIKSHFSVWPQYWAGCSVSEHSVDGEDFHRSGNRGVFLSQPPRNWTDENHLNIYISFRKMCMILLSLVIYAKWEKIHATHFWNMIYLLKITLKSENKCNIVEWENFLSGFLGEHNKVWRV